ncbi:MAG: hypothetical protein U5N56_06645 [Candidatus Marinimicrobia bacterium]|nr:hypothetical protein [Candidatus Neomarinimicrobiota bacterium]
MKKRYYFLCLSGLFFLFSCNLFNNEKTGTLVFKGVINLPEGTLAKSAVLAGSTAQSENTHLMYPKDVKFNVYEIWVSQEQVSDSLFDLFTWNKIGENRGLKFMHEYEMTAEDLPEGTYRSMKFIFRNEFLRYACYVADTSSIVLMASSITEGAAPDSSFVINYFSSEGSFVHTDNGFQLMSAGENVATFRINADRVTTVYWKGGGPGYHWTDVTFQWHDVDEDSAWTPGVDFCNNFEGPANMPMWTFMVVEE